MTAGVGAVVGTVVGAVVCAAEGTVVERGSTKRCHVGFTCL